MTLHVSLFWRVTQETRECVAMVLWLRGQSWQQSLYLGCVGIQRLSWPQFRVTTTSAATLRMVVVIQGSTRGLPERLSWWGRCEKALGSSMWCIHCWVAYSEAVQLSNRLLLTGPSHSPLCCWCWHALRTLAQVLRTRGRSLGPGHSRLLTGREWLGSCGVTAQTWWQVRTHLVLTVGCPAHSQLLKSLPYRILWHETDSVAKQELEQHLAGGADKFGNALPHYTWQPDDPAIALRFSLSRTHTLSLTNTDDTRWHPLSQAHSNTFCLVLSYTHSVPHKHMYIHTNTFTHTHTHTHTHTRTLIDRHTHAPSPLHTQQHAHPHTHTHTHTHTLSPSRTRRARWCVFVCVYVDVVMHVCGFVCVCMHACGRVTGNSPIVSCPDWEFTYRVLREASECSGARDGGIYKWVQMKRL